MERRPNPAGQGSLYYLTAAGQELVHVAIQLGNWGARWLELAPEDYDPFVVLRAWKMHVQLDRLPQPRIVIGLDLRDRPKQKFWLLLQPPEPELCIKHPGYDEDLVITTDSRTLTLIHLGRLALADAERKGSWHVDGSPALVRGLAKWGGPVQPLRSDTPGSQSRFHRKIVTSARTRDSLTLHSAATVGDMRECRKASPRRVPLRVSVQHRSSCCRVGKQWTRIRTGRGCKPNS